MADVVGLVSSIIQLVTFSADVAATLKEYYSNKANAPRVLRNIEAQIRLLHSSLEPFNSERYISSLEPNVRNSLGEVIKGCNEQITELDVLLRRIKPDKSSHAIRKGFKAISSIWKRGYLEDILRSLDRYKATLALHLLQYPCQPQSSSHRMKVFMKTLTNAEPITLEVSPSDTFGWLQREYERKAKIPSGTGYRLICKGEAVAGFVDCRSDIC
jgi:hypothetical protein